MSILVVACPRCGAQKMSFDVLHSYCIATEGDEFISVDIYEAFCICRECKKSTVFVLQSNLQNVPEENCVGVNVIEYVSQKHFAAHTPPEHLPEDVKSAFTEGVTCFAVGCFNAACIMFHRCLERSVREKWKKLSGEEKAKARKENAKSLPEKLNWLFQKGKIPDDFRGLSEFIRESGNEAKHGEEASKEIAEDMRSCTLRLLEDLSIKTKAKLANKEREERLKNNT
ncbi:MAG: DUF4145 domain-containing protein [Gammaproteobacteria bacterium]